jgi:hypothetical protein
MVTVLLELQYMVTPLQTITFPANLLHSLATTMHKHRHILNLPKPLPGNGISPYL